MKDILKWVAYGSVFTVPFVLLLVSSTMFFPFITGKNFTFRILVEIGFAAWLLLAFIDQAYRPRLSYIWYAILGLVGVMFLANLLGEYPPKSFWSNYERMEGWITLAHFAMYFTITASLLSTEKLWNRFFNTALVAAGIMSYFALAQMAGVEAISQGASWRVDGRLGNSTYLGVYMLFHVFIAAWMLLRTGERWLRVLYGSAIVLFVYVLSQTGTRGAMYGLIGGGILGFLYLAVMAPRGAAIKKWALGGLLAVVLIVAGVWSARDSDFVKDSPALNRFAGTTLAEGNIRFLVWGMALEGVKEHPLLGWGQENFSYVFNKYYDPALYGAEAWYDRTHNIFFDWLIAGGILGLLAYLSILVAALWYAVVRPFSKRFFKIDDARTAAFTVYEQALILGLLAAYMFHNLFVFDNLGSWIFYAVVLALIHARVSSEWPSLKGLAMDKDVWMKVVVPTTLVATLGLAYFLNVPSMSAARDIINAYRVKTPAERLESLDRAWERGGFADQEIFEQLTQIGVQMVSDQNATASDRERVMKLIDERSREMKSRKPGDARIHLITANFYRAAGNLDAAMAELDAAEKLSPTKQALIEEQGLIYLLANREAEALERYQKAYDLERSNLGAKVRLAAAALYFDDRARFDELLPMAELSKKGDLWYRATEDQMLYQIAFSKGDTELLEYIAKARIERAPEDKALRVNLAALYFEQGQIALARAVVEEAIADIPSFKEEGEALLERLNEAE